MLRATMKIAQFFRVKLNVTSVTMYFIYYHYTYTYTIVVLKLAINKFALFHLMKSSIALFVTKRP